MSREEAYGRDKLQHEQTNVADDASAKLRHYTVPLISVCSSLRGVVCTVSTRQPSKDDRDAPYISVWVFW